MSQRLDNGALRTAYAKFKEVYGDPQGQRWRERYLEQVRLVRQAPGDGWQAPAFQRLLWESGGVSGIGAVSSAGQAIAINNSGLVENSTASSAALAIKTAGGVSAIANTGRIIGTVALGDLGSTVDNSGIWNTAGGTNTFGALIAGNGVTNEAGGTIVAADDATATQQTVFTNVGTFTLTFTSATQANFSYNVDGVNRSIVLTKIQVN